MKITRLFVLGLSVLATSCSPTQQKSFLSYNSETKKITKEIRPAEPVDTRKSLLNPTKICGNDSKAGDKITECELKVLREQLTKCWSVNVRNTYLEFMPIEIELTVYPNRYIEQASVVDIKRFKKDENFRALASSALNALATKECEMLNLPPNKPHLWQKIIVVFDPREISQARKGTKK